MNILQEYENQNARRRYPFADNASMLDTNGTELADDVLLDAHLYPLVPSGVGLYLSVLDTAQRTLTLRRTDNNTEYATADIPETPGAASVFEVSGYNRQVGVLVFGPGVEFLYSGATVRTFTADALFCPTCLISLAQTGVRGYLLPDGTLITGDVVFTGQDGVLITSIADGSVLRFDIIGTVDPLPELCDDGGPPICVIDAVRLPGSPFIIGAGGDANTLVIGTFGYDLDDVCAAAKAKYLPSVDGTLPGTASPTEVDQACDPVVVPVVPPTDPGQQQVTLDICGSTYPSLTIEATSLAPTRNGLQVTAMTPVPAPYIFPRPKVIEDPSQIDTLLRSVNLKQFPQNGILIGFRGIT